MKIEDFAKQFPQKLQELTDYVNSEEIKDIIGVEAVNHFKGSFDNGLPLCEGGDFQH